MSKYNARRVVEKSRKANSTTTDREQVKIIHDVAVEVSTRADTFSQNYRYVSPYQLLNRPVVSANTVFTEDPNKSLWRIIADYYNLDANELIGIVGYEDILSKCIGFLSIIDRSMMCCNSIERELNDFYLVDISAKRGAPDIPGQPAIVVGSLMSTLEPGIHIAFNCGIIVIPNSSGRRMATKFTHLCVHANVMAHNHSNMIIRPGDIAAAVINLVSYSNNSSQQKWGIASIQIIGVARYCR